MSVPRVTGQQAIIWDIHPMARRDDPESSHQAADALEVSGDAKLQRRKAIALVKLWNGMTARELAALAARRVSGTKVDSLYHMLARRLPEAEDEGLVHALKPGPRLRWWPGPNPTGECRRKAKAVA